jgi:hypothetical protein
MRRLIQKNDNQHARMPATDRLRQFESIPGLVVELSANHHKVRAVEVQTPNEIGRRNR